MDGRGRRRDALRLEAGPLARLLRLWRRSQGGATRDRALARLARLVAERVKKPRPRVLDLFCGPGDAGEAVAAELDGARVDRLDGNAFLLELARLRGGSRGRTFLRDASRPGWARALGRYDVVVCTTALHWFDRAGARRTLARGASLLRPGGVLALGEPLRARRRAGTRTRDRAWREFWRDPVVSAACAEQPGPRPAAGAIGDRGLSAAGWRSLLGAAGCHVLAEEATRSGWYLAVATPLPAVRDGRRGERGSGTGAGGAIA